MLHEFSPEDRKKLDELKLSVSHRTLTSRQECLICMMIGGATLGLSILASVWIIKFFFL